MNRKLESGDYMPHGLTKAQQIRWRIAHDKKKAPSQNFIWGGNKYSNRPQNIEGSITKQG